MADQPKYTAYAPSALFADGASVRPLVPGVVPQLPPAPAQPPLSATLLARGRERFDIACAPCHGRIGDGQGRIVQRGFPAPPSYHTDSLRSATDQHLYDVITHGYGVMYPYADRVAPVDRWAIVAYIRALQRAQHATLADVPERERARLESAP